MSEESSALRLRLPVPVLVRWIAHFARRRPYLGIMILLIALFVIAAFLLPLLTALIAATAGAGLYAFFTRARAPATKRFGLRETADRLERAVPRRRRERMLFIDIAAAVLLGAGGLLALAVPAPDVAAAIGLCGIVYFGLRRS